MDEDNASANEATKNAEQQKHRRTEKTRDGNLYFFCFLADGTLAAAADFLPLAAAGVAAAPAFFFEAAGVAGAATGPFLGEGAAATAAGFVDCFCCCFPLASFFALAGCFLADAEAGAAADDVVAAVDAAVAALGNA